MKLSEYAELDGLAVGRLVREGAVSRTEIRDVALDAIDLCNPALNAVIEVYRDADVTGDSSELFAGVPFLLKDIGSHDAGVLFEMGSRLSAGLRAPPFASELVNRFRKSGVVILGRTNVPELGSSCTTEPILYGPTRNPWNLGRTPGGSSGGAAAAVASGMVPIAHANDAGGSIRWPASCCGLFGLKPSRNLNPVGPDAGLALNGLACEHIVSRTVRDTAAMLDETAGPDVGAWCYTPRRAGSYLEAIATPPRPLRIALNLSPNFPPATIEANVVDAITDVARLCESLGHQVEVATLDMDSEPLLRAFAIIWSSSLRTGIEGLSLATGRVPGPDTIEPHVLAAWRDAADYDVTDVMQALDTMNVASRAYGRFFEAYDVMLTPAGAMEPFELGRIGQIKAENFFDWFMGMCAHCPFLSTANIAGIPAMSVPLAWSAWGLPIGAHFLGRMGDEALLLQLASQLEEARPWIGRTPPHHVSRLV